MLAAMSSFILLNKIYVSEKNRTLKELKPQAQQRKVLLLFFKSTLALTAVIADSHH